MNIDPKNPYITNLITNNAKFKVPTIDFTEMSNLVDIQIKKSSKQFNTLRDESPEISGTESDNGEEIERLQ